MPTAPTKQEFNQIFDDLQKVIDVDDSRGLSVPSNMNFTEEGYLTKDKGSSLLGALENELCHSDYNYKKKDGTEYRLRAKGKFLQTYNSTENEWTNLKSGDVTITTGSPAIATLTAHGLKAGTKVSFTTDGDLPTGITEGTTYYVISTGLNANQFQFSETEGGTAVNTSGTQSGIHSLYRNYTENAEFGFYTYDNELFFSNSYENYTKWTGSSFVEYENAPKGNSLEIFEDRMFVAGVIDEPLTIYYSNVGDATTFSSTDVVKPLGTDEVLTIKNYYGVLMIFKRNSIYKLSFIYDQVVSLFVPKLEVQSGNYGVCSRKGVSWVENDLWFFTGREVRALGFIDQQTGQFGVNKTVISEPIKETLELLQEENLSSVVTFYHNRRFYLAVPLGVGAVNDTVFVSHLLYKNLWTKYTNRIKANTFDFIEINNIIYTSISNGNYGTLKWDDNLKSDFNNTDISSEVFFKKIENEDFNTYNTYRYLDLMFKDLTATVKVTIKSDSNDLRLSNNKDFYVGSVIEGEENSLGEVDPGQYWVADSFGESVAATPFLRKRISFLSKAQSLTIGLSNSSNNEDFTIAAYSVSGFKQPRRLFGLNKITSM